MPRWQDRGEANLVRRPLRARFPSTSGTRRGVPPPEFGKGVVHGLGAAVEIARLGRFGEALQYVFDKGLLIRAAFAFGDDVKRYADRVSQLHYRLIKVDNFAGPQRTCEFENCRPFKTSVGGLRDFPLVEERNDPLGNAHR